MASIDQILDGIHDLEAVVKKAGASSAHLKAGDIQAIVASTAKLWENVWQLQMDFCVRMSCNTAMAQHRLGELSRQAGILEEALQWQEQRLQSLEETRQPDAAPAPETAPQPAPASPAKPAEAPVTEKHAASLNDILEQRQLSDLRKAFSLNDRFRYRKELFDGDEARMNEAIDKLNGMHSHDEVLEYVNQVLGAKKDSPAFADFVKLLEKRNV